MKSAISRLAGLSDKQPKNGYTIVEVLIVLAISTTLMFAAIVAFKGQQSETEYNQSLQDLNSKILNYSAQTSAGTFPDSNNYSCAAGSSGLPPTLNTIGGNLGGREGCIFLGRAFHVDNTPSTVIHVYTVVGNRSASSGDVAMDITDASPTVATINSPPVLVMNDDYQLQYGSNITKEWAEDTNGTSLGNNYSMAGVYSSLNPSDSDSGNNVTANTIGLNLWGYHLPDTVSDTTNIKKCVESQGPYCNSGPVSIGSWNLCIADANGSHPMQLKILSSSQGLNTKLIDKGNCP